MEQSLTALLKAVYWFTCTMYGYYFACGTHVHVHVHVHAHVHVHVK